MSLNHGIQTTEFEKLVKFIEKEGWTITDNRISGTKNPIKSPTKPLSNRELLINLQKDFCLASDIPMFMSTTGFCIHCGFDFVKEYKQELSHVYVTYCPQCNRSFCE